MIKILSAAILALGLAGCGGGSGGGGFPVLPPVADTPNTGVPVSCTVTLHGDSIMHGGYNIFDRLIPPPAQNLKGMRPKYEIIDLSYNGGNASYSLGGILSDPISSDIVVVQFGMNDLGNNMPYALTMRVILERLKALDKKVIITGIIRSGEGFENYVLYNDIARNLAEEFGATWAAWDEVEYTPPPDIPDGLHPSLEYSTRLVARLAEALDEVAPECK